MFYTKDGAMWEICYIKDVDDFKYFDLLQAKNIQEAFDKAQKMIKGQIVGVTLIEKFNNRIEYYKRLNLQEVMSLRKALGLDGMIFMPCAVGG